MNGIEHGFRFKQAFLIFLFRHAVNHNASACPDGKLAVLQESRMNENEEIRIAIEADITDRRPINPPALLFYFVDDFT